MTDHSTGTRWQETVAAAIPGLPFPLRKDRGQRAVWPEGLVHLQPTPQDRLPWIVDRYLDEKPRNDGLWPSGMPQRRVGCSTCPDVGFCHERRSCQFDGGGARQ